MKVLCAKLHNGVLLPALGLGTWQLPESSETEQVVQHAVQSGYRHVDTASMYANQRSIGNAVSHSPIKLGTPQRDDIRVAGRFVIVDEVEFQGNYRIPFPDLVQDEAARIFVTGKVSTDELALGERGIRESVEKHLSEVGRSIADLILLHFPAPSKVSPDDPENPRRRLEAWKVMEVLYREKKTRSIGVSNYMIHHLKPLVEDVRKRRFQGDTNAIIPMVNQIEFSPYCPCDSDLITLCETEGIVMESYSTLGSAKGKDKILKEAVILELAKKKQVSPAAIVLRWALEKNFVVLPRSRDICHVDSNLQCLYIELDKSEEEKVTEIGLTTTERFCWDPTKVV